MMRVFRYWLSSFGGLKQGTWFLAFITLVNRAGTMVVPYMSLYITKELGKSATTAGIVLSFFGAGSVLGSYIGGKLTDKIGAYKVMAVSLIGAAMVMASLPSLGNITLLAGGMFLTGFMGEAYRPASYTAISALEGEASRRRAFALIRLAINLGMIIGPVVGGFLAMNSYSHVFYVDSVTCLSAGFLVIAVMRKMPADPTSQPKTKEAETATDAGLSPWRDAHYLTFIALVTVFAMVIFQVFVTYPLYLNQVYGLNEAQFGKAMAVNGVMIVLFEMLITRSVEHRNPNQVIAGGVFMVGLGLAVLPLGSGFGFAVFSVVLWTIGEMLESPSAATVAANTAPDSRRGEYLGLFSACYGLGFLGAPIIGAWVYDTFGPETLWYGCGLVCVLTAMGFLLLAKRKPEQQQTQQAEPVAVT